MPINFTFSGGKHNAIKNGTKLNILASSGNTVTSISFDGIAKHGVSTTDTVTCTGSNGTDFFGTGSEGTVTISNFTYTTTNSSTTGSITYIHSKGNSHKKGKYGMCGDHSDTGTFAGTSG